jgi:MFS family permease
VKPLPELTLREVAANTRGKTALIGALKHAFVDQAGAVTGVFRNRELRRLELAWGGFFVVEWATLLALSVWAYRQGGASAAGVVGLLRMLPAAVALPFGSMVTDRFARHRVLAVVYSVQAFLLLVVAATIAAGGPRALVYLLVALVGVAAAPCRPAQLAIAPVLARSPEELVAANVAQTTFEGVATLVGPALAGVLLALSGASVALAAAAAVSAFSAVLVGGVGTGADPTRAARRGREPVAAALTGGVRELARLPDVAIIVGGFWAQTLVRGMLNVYIVALALTTLALGEGGAGLLSGAFGAGVIFGALVTTTLVGRRRLSLPSALGLVLWGLPLVVIGVWPTAAVAVVALVVSGIGNAELDVSGFTLMQRLADDRVLGRVFGVMYVGVLATVGVGSVLAPLAIRALGISGAVIASGALLPAVAALLYRRLTQIDRRASVPEGLDILAAVPLFEPLPPTSLEKLARAADRERVEAGSTIIREGERGESFYVIVDGLLRVTSCGEQLRDLEAGEVFGEIALLRDVPRTATVTATTDATLLVIRRMDFLSAILGTLESATTVEELITHRIDTTPLSRR